MADFTYTVFVIVASLAGALITLFAAGVVGVLLQDPGGVSHAPGKPADAPVDYRHAA